MHVVLEFIRHCMKILKYSIYPILELYGYFVFCGLFCIQSSSIDKWTLVVNFAIFNIMAMLKIILYLELFIIETKNTLDIFARLTQDISIPTYHNINPFVIDSIVPKALDKIRICHVCKTYKPPRAHHSSMNNRCYLKYSHYCGMLDAPIGFHNHKSYFQFILIFSISAIYFLVLIGTEALVPEKHSAKLLMNYVVGLAAYTIALLVSGYIMVQQIRLIGNNETLVESSALNAYIKGDYSQVHIFQEGPIKSFSPSKDRTVLNPYNLGWKKNWIEVFGSGPWKWFEIGAPSHGDGINFPTNENMGVDDDIYTIM